MSGEPLTPPDAVDQAWHLHMVYTRDYWHHLCRDIVGRDIHHEPTSGGPERREHYRSRYARTIDLYRATFDAAPPTDIWPVPSERFSHRFQRIDRTRTMVFEIERLRWVGVACAGLICAVLATVIGLGAGHLTIALIIAVAILLGMLASHRTAKTDRRRGAAHDGGCSTDAGYVTAGDPCDGGDGGGDGGCGGGCGGD